MALGNELIKAAKEEGGYPDSDDSDDEDDESRSSRMTAESVGEKKSRKDRQSAASSMSKAATQRKPISLQRHKLDIFTK